jgi:subtilisin family serine protease
MKKRYRILPLVAACVCVPWIWKSYQGAARQYVGVPQAPEKHVVKRAPDGGIHEEFAASATSTDRKYKISLEHALVKKPDGTERLVSLPAGATLENLPNLLKGLASEGEVLPVCYLANSPRRQDGWFAITKDLTVKLADPSLVPSLPAGLGLKERPDYAPEYAVLSASDPFEALKVLPELEHLDGVAMAEIQLARKHVKMTLPNDPMIRQQWHLTPMSGTGVAATSTLKLESVWNYGSSSGIRGKGVTIGIFDDSLQINHPDLAANVSVADCWDFNGNDANPSPTAVDDDHGTACGGLAAAVGNNALGVSGTAPEATLAGYRLISAATTDSTDAAAMSYLPQKVSVRSNSWGPVYMLDGPGTLAKAAIANGAKTGRGGLGNIFLWAAGNSQQAGDNANYDGWASDIHVITVAASDSNGIQSYYSEQGANVLICAPSNGSGTPITTTDRTGASGYSSTDYATDFGGTSAATPEVAGVVALLLQKNPQLGWRDVQEILVSSAYKINPTDAGWFTNGAGFHFNHKFGAGIVDAAAAVELAGNWTNLDTQSVLEKSNAGTVVIPDNNSAGVTVDFAMTSQKMRVEKVGITFSSNHTRPGDLKITLTSPSGVTSKLAELHTDDGNTYQSWFFSSVHFWGEDSRGVWKLNVSDGRKGVSGSITEAKISIYGVLQNTAPTVAVTSPADGASVTPNQDLQVSVSASDVNLAGDPGTINSVTLFDNGNQVGILTQAPYIFSYRPEVGSHTLKAVALDSEGSSTTSSEVHITVENQAPRITNAVLSATGQAFADEDLDISDLVATDDEQDAIFFSYDWQYLGADESWISSGITTATLPADDGHAGKIWHCHITPRDSGDVGSAYDTQSINLLRRAPDTITKNQALNYDSGLVVPVSGSPRTKNVIINEFSRGSVAGCEWIELLVINPVSLRNYRLSGSSSYSLTFADDPVWDDIAPGTLIVIYKNGVRDPILPPDGVDANARLMVLSSADITRFTGTWPAFSGAGSAVNLSDASGTLAAGFSFAAVTNPAPHFTSLYGSNGVYFAGADESSISDVASWKFTNNVTSGLPVSYGGPWKPTKKQPPIPSIFEIGSTVAVKTISLGGVADKSSLGFSKVGSYMRITLPTQATSLSYNIRADKKKMTGTFVVMESSDGSNYTMLRSFTNKDDIDTRVTDALKEDTRFLKFVLAVKGKQTILLDQISITSAATAERPDGFTPGQANCPANAAFMSALKDDVPVGELRYFITSGALPEGLTLDPETGVISGTPTGVEGQNPLTLLCRNSAGASSKYSFDLKFEGGSSTTSFGFAASEAEAQNASVSTGAAMAWLASMPADSYRLPIDPAFREAFSMGSTDSTALSTVVEDQEIVVTYWEDVLSRKRTSVEWSDDGETWSSDDVTERILMIDGTLIEIEARFPAGDGNRQSRVISE